MAKRRKGKPPASAEFVKALAAIRNRGNVRTGLAALKLGADPSQLRRILPQLLKMPAYRPLIWPAHSPIKVQQLWIGGIPAQASFETELEWAVQTLIPQKSVIISFLGKKLVCERHNLLGKSNELERELNEIENEFGSSLWLIENRINAIQTVGGFSKQKTYTHEIISDKSISPLIRYIVSWFSYRTEENMSTYEFNKLVEESITVEGGFSNLVRVILGTQGSLDLDDASAAISYCDALAPIDRYLYLIASVQAAVAADASERILESIADSLAQLYRAVPDPALKRLLLVCSPDPAAYSADRDLLPLLDAYTLGNRKKAAAEIVRLLSEASIDALVLAIRMGLLDEVTGSVSELSRSIPFGKIGEDLFKILTGDANAAEAEGRLSKLRLTNSSSAWAADLNIILLRLRQDDRVHNPSASHMYAALRASRDNPMLAFSLRSPGQSSKYLEAFSREGPTGPTTTVLRNLLHPDETDLPSDIPEARAHRMRALGSVRQKDYAEARTLLESLLEGNLSPIEKIETLLLLADVHLRDKDLNSAATVCVDLILMSSYHTKRVPIQGLVDEIILSERESDRSTGLVLGTLPMTIIMDMYSRFVGNTFDPEKIDAFNDLLEQQCVDRPSKLNFEQFSIEWQLYFLRYVCVPDVLDQCLSLKSTSEVEDERATLIVRCADLYALNEQTVPDELQNELQDIRTRQVVRDTNLKLDQSKIFVDIDGIQTQFSSSMRESWNRYRLLSLHDSGTSLEEMTKALEEALGRRLTIVSLTLPITEKFKLFARMIREIRDQFASSKLFGLDANLSTNIRHGYILRELRGPFVSGHLVTNLQGGDYQPNLYWSKRFEGVGASKLRKMLGVLNEFSRRVDGEIESLNRERVRINSENSPFGLFDFSIGEVELQLLQHKVDQNVTYEDFVRTVLDHLWQRTEESLDGVRKYVKEHTLGEFQLALTQLQEDADKVLPPAQASALRQAITLTRPEVASATDRVASWFTLSTSRDYQDYPLKVAYDAGVATVKSYFSNVHLRAAFDYDAEILMQGWTLPHFARLYSILIENAALHSGIGEGDLNIHATAFMRDDSLEISVRNEVSADLDGGKLAATIARLNRDFGSEAAAEFIRVEQGSGYPKIWKILRHDLHREHALQVSLTTKGEFEVEAIMNKDGVISQ